jgi:hypothetical protein
LPPVHPVVHAKHAEAEVDPAGEYGVEVPQMLQGAEPEVDHCPAAHWPRAVGRLTARASRVAATAAAGIATETWWRWRRRPCPAVALAGCVLQELDKAGAI